jgi:hypothetical protein
MADESSGGTPRADGQIIDALGVSKNTVCWVRERFVEQGFEEALVSKPPARTYACKLDGRGEAHLIALACSKPLAASRSIPKVERAIMKPSISAINAAAIHKPRSYRHVCITALQTPRNHSAYPEINPGVPSVSPEKNRIPPTVLVHQ